MRYLKRALQDIRHNRFLSLVTVVTIALSVLIVSAFALFFLNGSDLINAWKKGVNIMVYLKNDRADTEVADRFAAQVNDELGTVGCIVKTCREVYQ